VGHGGSPRWRHIPMSAASPDKIAQPSMSDNPNYIDA
jgi:hypothetical protein